MGSIGIFVAQTGGRKLIFRQPNNKKNILMDWGFVKKEKKKERGKFWGWIKFELIIIKIY